MMRGTRLTDAQQTEARQRYAAGETLAAIAAALGETFGVVRGFIHRTVAADPSFPAPRLRRHTRPASRTPPPTPAEVAAMAAAYRAGEGLLALAARVHIGATRLRALLVEAGVAIRPNGWRWPEYPDCVEALRMACDTADAAANVARVVAGWGLPPEIIPDVLARHGLVLPDTRPPAPPTLYHGLPADVVRAANARIEASADEDAETVVVAAELGVEVRRLNYAISAYLTDVRQQQEDVQARATAARRPRKRDRA